MSIVSGYNKYKRYILTDSGYKLVSQWTNANTVEMDDGSTLQSTITSLNSTLNKLQNTYLFRLSLGNEQQITSTSYVDIVTINNQTIKAGKYMCLVSINATWTQRYYQFNIRIKIGDNISDIGASVSAAQTNVPVNCRSFINIPTDGAYSISIQVQVTNSRKAVTIETYQNPTLVLIPCINAIVFEAN